MPAAGASTWIIQSVDAAAANSSSLGMPLYNPFTTLARAEGAEAVNRSSGKFEFAEGKTCRGEEPLISEIRQCSDSGGSGISRLGHVDYV